MHCRHFGNLYHLNLMVIEYIIEFTQLILILLDKAWRIINDYLVSRFSYRDFNRMRISKCVYFISIVVNA